MTARAFNLPSKNYIENWIKQLKKKGLLPMDKQKATTKSSIKVETDKDDNQPITISKSPREIQLEKENLRLQAEVDYLKKLQELQRGNAQEN